MATRQKQEEEEMNPEELDRTVDLGLYWVTVKTELTPTGFMDILAVLIPVDGLAIGSEIGCGWLRERTVTSCRFISVGGVECPIVAINNRVTGLID